MCYFAVKDSLQREIEPGNTMWYTAGLLDGGCPSICASTMCLDCKTFLKPANLPRCSFRISGGRGVRILAIYFLLTDDKLGISPGY